MYDLASRQAHALTVAKGINSLAGAETAFSHDSARMLYRHEGPNAPNDLWTYELTSQKPLQITHSLVGGIRSEDMVEPFLVHYPSNESMRVSHETIYRSLFIQARGVLKKELIQHLRSKRLIRRSRHARATARSTSHGPPHHGDD